MAKCEACENLVSRRFAGLCQVCNDDFWDSILSIPYYKEAVQRVDSAWDEYERKEEFRKALHDQLKKEYITSKKTKLEV